LVDRWNRRKILIATQVLSMAQSLALAALALTGAIAVWHVLLLNVFQGFVNAFDVPARQAFVVEMVDRREDLGNAIALNSTIFNGTRLVGPSIAGIVIAASGEGWCFLLDGLTYLAVIAAFAAMRLPLRQRRASSEPLLGQLAEGLRYAAGFAPIRTILIFIGMLSLLGMPYTVLLPVFAGEILHGNASTYGFLMGAIGLGALSGALYLASRHSVIGLGRMVAGCSMLFAVGLAAFSYSRQSWLSWLLLAATGFGMLVQMAGSNTLLQTLVDDDKRGRVMSLYATAFSA
jgi:MFS family permease